MLIHKYSRTVFTVACFFAAGCSFAQGGKKIILSNPLNAARKDELIILPKKLLQTKLGGIKNDQYIQIKDSKGRPVVVQFDDLDQDGSWDEAVFLYSFKPLEKVNLVAAVSENPAAVKAVVRAHVRLRKKNADDSFGPQLTSETMPLKNPATDFAKQPLPLYLTEGPAWENDKVAFRQYMDVRNGRDIFAKRVTHMVMDSVGVVVEPSYHNLNDWGMDVLHVGKSLGAGAVAFKIKINGKDSLIRLGGENISETIYQQLSDGPIRASFRMSYSLVVNGKIIKVIDETSIYAGQYFYENKLKVTGLPAGAQLVTGIANFNENQSKHFFINNAAVLYSHGKQSENKDELGMAVMVQKHRFTGFGATPDSGVAILNSYTVSQRLSSAPAKYRFYAGWGKSNLAFNKRIFFEQFLVGETQKLNKPITIAVL